MTIILIIPDRFCWGFGGVAGAIIGGACKSSPRNRSRVLTDNVNDA